MSPAPDDAASAADPTRRLEEFEARQRQNSQKLQARLQEISKRVTSQDKTIAVTVGAGGGVQSIELTNQALRHGPQRLSDLLVSLIRAGEEQVRDETMSVVRSVMGNSLDLEGLAKGDITGPALPDPKGFAQEKGVEW